MMCYTIKADSSNMDSCPSSDAAAGKLQRVQLCTFCQEMHRMPSANLQIAGNDAKIEIKLTFQLPMNHMLIRALYPTICEAKNKAAH